MSTLAEPAAISPSSTAADRLLRSEGEIEGYPVRVNMVDVNSIGAGGGSLAWLDAAGGLRVGPESAGADPGPACYGRGGDRATVTDASVVLGYINPEYFAGGSVDLDPERAFGVIKSAIAEPMGFSVERAAQGIHRVVNAQMAEGIRLVSMQRGYDPRRFALVALGGAGPRPCNRAGRRVGDHQYYRSGKSGACCRPWALLMAPIEHEVTMSLQRDLVDLSPIVVVAALENLDTRCHQLMEAEGVSTSDTEIRHLADVCYIGQSYHLEVRLHLDDTAPLDRLYRDFKIVHDRVHGHATDAPVKIVNLRSVHSIGRGEGLGVDGYGTDCPDSRKGHRSVLFANADGPRETAIYQRERLAPAERIDGPAIIEQPDTTTIVSVEWRAIVQDSGDLIVEKNGTLLTVAREHRAMDHGISSELDPITVEVIRHKLEGIANEMQHSLLRSAFSPIVKEGLDASASLFTLDGETLAQAIAIPIHLGTLIPIVGEILKRNPVETLVDGDIFIMNDPYLGGTHLPDIALVMPIFADGRALGLSAAMMHHQDVGGMTPGSVPTNATEIFQEGIRDPAAQIGFGRTDRRKPDGDSPVERAPA